MMDKSKNNTKGSGSNEEMKIRKQDSDAIVDEL